MTWRSRSPERVKDSLTSSYQLTPGADYSLTQWTFTGRKHLMVDYLGLSPWRVQKAALPRVSQAGNEAGWRAFDLADRS